jgi:hypothetical protein
MAGMGELFGRNGVLEQLMLWGVANQVISALGTPAFTAITQDAQAKFPEVVLSPQVMAEAAARYLATAAQAKTESAHSGINASRAELLIELAKVRISPAELAEAVLRSYMTLAEAEAEAKPQGITAAQLKVLRDLAGDAPGPDELAMALRRGIIHRSGTGAASTSFDQGIAETRLHNKWGPVVEELSRAILSAPDAAQAVVRGFLPLHAGTQAAALSGVSAADFAVMVELAADAPSPGQLAEALRRQVIPFDSGDPSKPGFTQGIEQGRLANKWIPMIRALAQLWPTPTDALEARLVGQVTTKESQDLYAKFGGDPQYWQLLFDTRGEAPTPLELGVLANRGDIPWDGLGADVISFGQGFHEGRWRNKWQQAYRKLAIWRVPESTTVEFLTHGIIDDTQAAANFAKLGMDAETIRQYIAEAHFNATSDFRGSTITMVLQAYHEQLLNADQATQLLEGFHVTPQAVRFMLDFEDAQRAFAAINNVVTRTRTLYANRKITVQTAGNALTELGIPLQSVTDILKSWQLENSITVKVLTEAQIADAFIGTLLTQDEAMTELENIGYTPFDAWILLSLKAKQPLPGQPVPGPAPPQGQVIPGTT